MSTETVILRSTVKLDAETAAGLFVDPDGSLPAAGEDALGPTYTKGAANELVAVTLLGIVPVQTTAAAVAVGDALKVAATGKVLKATANTVVVARALTAVGGAGGEIMVLVFPNAKI